ncbi:O-acetyl-ADP-ribose deacetylase (regulator of RNase III), contains Macro domain [Butyrivibrio proteoclasticus]|uniref:O-acetyl-ADP-ribose deacetylase (Regulator of RNase III), contains Macro domain n=1 Tax=Butyrivibrio proteoclasticus TaxID=43305 RepID=A0A1I5XBY8_9FIRM|nr:patatin-like phospholipase family protein [Butyrivibrio proteoclasticus]SFQ29167.1 O-acetyl-ADP-ribose deacetylase (regulator of RNase III), contains Macro domain [Butyrivibrio proteoclasticus]
MDIRFFEGNIANIQADAIVVPSNSALKESNGESNAIYDAAGRKNLCIECEALVKGNGKYAYGDAVATNAFLLDAQFLIHAVVPKLRYGNKSECDQIAHAYTNSLIVADGLKCKSIAFPLLGIRNGFDVKTVYRIASEQIQKYKARYIQKVFIVVHDKKTVDIITYEGNRVYSLDGLHSGVYSLRTICNKQNYLSQLEEKDIKEICSIINGFSLKNEIGLLFDDIVAYRNLPENYIIQKSRSGKCRVIRDNKTIIRCCDERILCYYLNNKICEKKKLSSLSDKNYGLVLCGGGARGAYQIGVWKALIEHTCLSFTGISGVSVGALNSLLFAQGNYEKAERVWMTIEEKDLKDFNELLELLKIGGLKLLESFLSVAPSVFLGSLSTLAYDQALENEENKQLIMKFRLASNNLSSIIDSAIDDWTLIDRNKILYSFVSRNFVFSTPENIPLTGLTVNEIKDVVLSSASLPIIYGSTNYKGKKYFDGGRISNVPYEILAEKGFKRILVIHLNPNDRKKKKYSLSSYNDAVIEHIYPSEPLGGLLTISKEKTLERMKRGYFDAVKWIDSNEAKTFL